MGCYWRSTTTERWKSRKNIFIGYSLSRFIPTTQSSWGPFTGVEILRFQIQSLHILTRRAVITSQQYVGLLAVMLMLICSLVFLSRGSPGTHGLNPLMGPPYYPQTQTKPALVRRSYKDYFSMFIIVFCRKHFISDHRSHKYHLEALPSILI